MIQLRQSKLTRYSLAVNQLSINRVAVLLLVALACFTLVWVIIGVGSRNPAWAILSVVFLLIAVTAVFTIAWRVDVHFRKRADKGICTQCGYDRAGLDPSTVCPECGRTQ